MTRRYLDHNATAPVRPEVIEAVAEAMGRDGNALSVHAEGRAAHALVESARELTGARWGVISTVDESGDPLDFVFSGFTQE